MQWDVIVEDLLGQLDQSHRAQVQGLAGELAQAEWAQTGVIDRLRAQGDTPIRCALAGGLSLSGTCVRQGADWLILDAGAVQALIPLSAVLTISGVGPRAQDATGVVAARLSMASVMRGLAERRVPVVIQLTSGAPVEGMIMRLGRDHLELMVDASDEPGTRVPGRSVIVLFTALAAVMSRQGD